MNSHELFLGIQVSSFPLQKSPTFSWKSGARSEEISGKAGATPIFTALLVHMAALRRREVNGPSATQEWRGGVTSEQQAADRLFGVLLKHIGKANFEVLGTDSGYSFRDHLEEGHFSDQVWRWECLESLGISWPLSGRQRMAQVFFIVFRRGSWASGSFEGLGLQLMGVLLKVRCEKYGNTCNCSVTAEFIFK